MDSAARIRQRLERRIGFEEKKMFGGVGFLLKGNMCVGVWKEFLILRVGLDQYASALAQPYVSEFDITGRSMKGWVMVHRRGFVQDGDLERWIELAIKFVETLPAK